MKKRFLILTALVLFVGAGLSLSSFAQEMGGTMGNQPMMAKEMMQRNMKDKGEMMGGCCPMHGMMMKGMMEKSVIATPDGGVIVLAGNRLIKYDQDLNVVKEVEIKMDMAAMQKNMAEMMNNCPMMKGAAMGAGMSGNASSKSAPSADGTWAGSEQKKQQGKY